MRPVYAALPLLLVAACQPTEPVAPAVTAPAVATPPASAPHAPSLPAAPDASQPVTARYGYRCGDSVLTVAFHGEGQADLTFDGRTLSLPHVRSGSGMRYADANGNTFFGKGTDQATLSRQDQADLACTGTGPLP